MPISKVNRNYLWSSHYDGSLDDIFAVQSEIAEKVAGELKVQLLASEKAAIEKRPTGNTDAYTDYLQGMQLVNILEERPALRGGVEAGGAAVRAQELTSHIPGGLEGMPEWHGPLNFLSEPRRARGQQERTSLARLALE